MMIKPGITELSRCVDSRYTLVTMAAKRARMIGEKTEDVNGKWVANKPVSIAADEIAAGKIGYVRSDAIRQAQEYEEEKAAAIQSYSEAALHSYPEDEEISEDIGETEDNFAEAENTDTEAEED